MIFNYVRHSPERKNKYSNTDTHLKDTIKLNATWRNLTNFFIYMTY